MKQIAENLCFGGRQLRFEHEAQSTSCTMTFSVFLPPQAQSEACPVLYWLSGLTCSDENFVQKSGFQRKAAELGLIVVAPDTSPRGEGVADDADGAWDFGLGAGFYLNATKEPWSQHYRMYDYIVTELPALIEKSFATNGQKSISGHSMGGHGALTIAFKNASAYQSVSAFAPIVAPIQVPWGQKAFAGYLGEDQTSWQDYDSCELLRAHAAQLKAMPIKIDQGASDSFLEQQLKPDLLLAAAKEQGIELNYQLRDGYDHSYFYIASFIDEHLAFHAAQLRK
ncbi:S-formylglutathione hydrolase [Agaribacterium haliotis]|uniref:S-formylglutathione hydrolase n=1 Tax=Agaribacterium haliotis TaxID=2013869 RepID=UPI000BB58E5F|nr:S-formylglutathione hydrolase [Agaribacterium haliotis]